MVARGLHKVRLPVRDVLLELAKKAVSGCEALVGELVRDDLAKTGHRCSGAALGVCSRAVADVLVDIEVPEGAVSPGSRPECPRVPRADRVDQPVMDREPARLETAVSLGEDAQFLV